jgi:hypothetical protein
MAIVLYDQPEQYQLAYNDNVWVFRGIPAPYRYIVKVYEVGNATPIATLKVFNTPATNGSTDRAFINLSRILQSKLSHDLTTPTANHLGFLQNTNSHLEYYITIGEDLNDGQEYRPYRYDTKSVWNGIQNNVDWLDFTTSDYLIDTGAGSHKFLTEGPTGTSYRDIGASESANLYFIGTENNAPAGYYLTTYSGYDGTGTQLNNILVSNPFAGSMANFDNQYLRIPVGTYDIPLTNISQYSSGNPATILNNVNSYRITLWDTGFPVSESVLFNIEKNCSKYTPVRLHWFNRLGGFDAFNFDLKNQETTDVKRKNYDQNPHTFTGFGWTYDKSDRGRTQYDTQLTKKLTVNTHYLNESESAWMESLFTSPEVYQELNNELIAVSVNGNSIQKKTSLNDKLMQYSFELEYAIKNSRQRG